MGNTSHSILIANANTWIEGNAVQQLHTTAQLPHMHTVAGMPNLHAGRGYPMIATHDPLMIEIAQSLTELAAASR